MDENKKEVWKRINRQREYQRNHSGYDQHTGAMCQGARVEVHTPVDGLPVAYVPEAMTCDPDYAAAQADALAWQRLRCRYDFEYWAIMCVRIKQKGEQNIIPFALNEPQRRILAILEDDRIAGRPMRIIILKARQWGGSTLIQMYMAWLQTCVLRNWNSVICAHVKDASATIRGMYSNMLAEYPPELWLGDEKAEFRPFERSANTRVIAGRGCRVTVGSAEKPDSLRGADYAMAHLSETAYWPDSRTRSPGDVIRSVASSIALKPNTLVAIESTAHGVGDYFHTEWCRAKAGLSDKHAFFVPWYMADHNTLPVTDEDAFLDNLDAEEEELFACGCTLGQLNWRRHKMREATSPEAFRNEYPANDTEAFLDSSDNVFSNSAVERLRARCSGPVDIGEVGTVFTPDPKGCLKVWHHPAHGARYVAAVDVGGRSAKADWSVIAVLRCDGTVPEVVAQWRGYLDHDLLARKAMALAHYYCDAHLIIESNTLETEGAVCAGGENLLVLNMIEENYRNLYMRRCFDVYGGGETMRVGFHTNRSTKGLIIGRLIEAIREGLYVEADTEACNEFLSYRQHPNGAYEAAEGCHDDILMTRALALHAIATLPAASRSASGSFRNIA